MKNGTFYRSAVLFSTLGLLATGCSGRDPNMPAPIVDGNAAAADPANANLLPTETGGASYAAQPQSSGARYAPAQYAQTAPQQAPSGRVTQNESMQYNTHPPAYAGAAQTQQPPAYDPNAPQQVYDQTAQPYPSDQQAANAAEYDEYQSLLDPNVPAAEQAPPQLPADYQQPEAPGPDYLWTPGYWDYASAGYYYVPGVWVSAPYEGALWTPGWWGSYGNRYRWHHGYWGRHVGYYGGINYGFGFIGFGYEGGYWNRSHFWYNTAVNRVRPVYVNNYVYNRRVEVVNRTYINNTRISYVGPGGLNRRPAPQEFAAMREQHLAPMQAQIANRREAEANRAQFFQQNHGRPGMVAVSRALPADRNITPPPHTLAAGNFNNGRPGTENRPGFLGGMPAHATPQQRQQIEQQRQQFNNQPRTPQEEGQRTQQEQRFGNPQQRELMEQQQRTGQLPSREAFQNQQRVQQEQQQRQQQELQRQQLQTTQQHNQMQRQPLEQQQQQQRQQQQQVEQQRQQQQFQQRTQQDQQRTQQDQQRQQMQQRQQEQQRQQQQQAEQQRQQMQRQIDQQRQQPEREPQQRVQQPERVPEQRQQPERVPEQRQQPERVPEQRQQPERVPEQRQQPEQRQAPPVEHLQQRQAPPPQMHEAPHEGGGEHRR